MLSYYVEFDKDIEKTFNLQKKKHPLWSLVYIVHSFTTFFSLCVECIYKGHVQTIFGLKLIQNILI